jgi:hypothetical protein
MVERVLGPDQDRTCRPPDGTIRRDQGDDFPVVATFQERAKRHCKNYKRHFLIKSQ